LTEADAVLRGGRIVTMDPARRVASALAVRGGRILAVGSDDEISATAGGSTEVVELGGRTVVPGLIDSHTHLELTAYSRHHWDDVRGLTPEGIVQRVRELAAGRPAGSWIVLQGTFGQEMPDRRALDGATSDHPVAVRWTMHKFQLNGAGLEAGGITRRSVAPPGTRIHFGSDGEPTGLVEEGWDLLDWAPPLAGALVGSISETATSLFLQHGVTCIHDIAASRGGIAAYQQLAAGEEILPRIGLALVAEPGHQALISTRAFARTGLPTGFGGDRVRLSAVKIFVDGGRDGAFRSEHVHDHGGRWGLLTRSPQQLAVEVSEALDAGLQVWIHAIGDLAQEVTVSAIEQAARAHPGADHRCRIEHFANEMYDPGRLHRLIAAGGIPAPNPSFIHAEPDDPGRRLPPGVVKYGIKTLRAAGARPPGNSDTAGAQPFSCNPWFTMERMLTRTNRNGIVIDPEEAVGLQEALEAFTVDAARATFQERDLGSLEPGKLADLAVLDVDPFSLAPSELHTVTVAATMVGGRLRWRGSSPG